MRVNPEPVPQHLTAHRRGVWILGALGALAVLVVVVQGLASFYVNYLWFGSAGVGVVWRAIVTSKLGLAGVFVAVAMALVWSSLWLVEKVAQRTLFLPAESDLVRRYHALVVPHAFVLRTAVSLLVALALGAGTSSQWEHWLLFRHAFSFGVLDPQFHRDASFYVFRLPFLSFLVDWVLIALLVTFLVSLLAHFLNGTIRVQGPAHVEPRAVAHLSLLLGMMALVRAWAYYYVDRYALEVPHNGGMAAGATPTGMSVRLPAITLLAVISLIAFVILVVNVYQRTLLLPLLAFGLWALVALAIDVIYPSVDSAIATAPASGGRASSSLTENATMTMIGMGLTGVTPVEFPAGADLTGTVLTHYGQSLDDVTLWDTSQAGAALSSLQDDGPYYALSQLSANRYVENGRLVPVDIGARELDTSQLPDPTWSEVRAQYTHGYGAVVSSASAVGSNRSPQVQLGGLPPAGSKGAPQLSAAGSRVYFAPDGREYVLVDTKQPEVDYQPADAARQTTAPPYDAAGSATIGVGGFLPRLAFAVHLHDFNLLVSDIVTPSTRLIYLTNVRDRVQKALPFMKVDSDPYAVIAEKQLYWVYSAYVTSSYFPDATPAETSVLPAGSGLGGSYDYVRDAVVAVVNARTGKMRLFALAGGPDPLLRAYEAAFPELVQSTGALRSFAGGQVYDHLRYPQDLLSVQAAMYGVYRPASSDADVDDSGPAAISAAPAPTSWSLAEAPVTSGSSAGALTVSGAPAPYQPQYELVQWSDDPEPTFCLVEPLVPYSGPSGTGGTQNLSALMVASSSPQDFGSLKVLDVDTSGVDGPYLADSQLVDIQSEISQQAQNGSVQYGAIELLPVADSLLDVQPVYLASPSSRYAVYDGVVVVYGKRITFAPSLAQALDHLVRGLSSAVPPRPSGNGPAATRIRSDIERAYAEMRRADVQLKRENLAGYQSDEQAAEKLIAQADSLERGGSAARSKGSSARRSGRSASRRVAAGGAPSTAHAAVPDVQRVGLRAAGAPARPAHQVGSPSTGTSTAATFAAGASTGSPLASTSTSLPPATSSTVHSGRA